MRVVPLKALTCSLCLILSGCSALERSPTGQAIASLNPHAGEDTAEQAQAIEYASIALETQELRGLAVLGAQTGNQTHWPTASGRLLSLQQGGLYAISTGQGDLLATRYRSRQEVAPQSTPFAPWLTSRSAPFTLERHWVDAQGIHHALSAEGAMQCGATEPRKLLLTTLALQRCEITYRWQDGQTTQAQWWREPNTLALWEVHEQAWPGGPDIQWQVARPWWNG